MENVKLGIGSWSYPWAIGVDNFPQPKNPLTVSGLFKKASQLGVEVVQICDNLPLQNKGDQELSKILDIANKFGITIEVGTRGVEVNNLLDYLNIAQKLESKIVRTTIHSLTSKPTLHQAKNWLEEVMPKFDKAEIALALENHEGQKARVLARLINEINNPCLGICLDTVNSFGALEGPDIVIEHLAPYIFNLHIKDFQITRVEHQMGFKITGCPAGKGLLDIAWLFDILNQRNRDINVILEQWPPYSGEIEETVIKENKWAQEGIKFLRKYIKD